MNEFNYTEEMQHCYNACLNITDACNLACRYCFVAQQPHFMTLDTAKDAVNFLVNNFKYLQEKNKHYKNNHISVTYFGGEPTLLFDEIIVPLTIWAKETYGDLINFGITTNGTLLNQERIQFMKDYNIVPLLSMDGGPETQNYNRPCRNENLNSFDLVYKNIPDLLRAFPQTTFRSTISEEKVDQIFNNYVFAAACGFKNIFMVPNSRTPWSTAAIQEMDNQYNKIYSLMLEGFKKGKAPIINCGPINDSFTHVLQHDLEVINGRNNWNMIERSPWRCGLGTYGCSIGYDGTIYGCQEQDSQDSSALFNIGNIYTGGINAEKHIQLLKTYAQPATITCVDKDLCLNCDLRRICKTYSCPSTSWSIFNNLFTMGISYCMWLKILFYYATQLMEILVKENNKTFEQYLDTVCSFDKYFKSKETSCYVN